MRLRPALGFSFLLVTSVAVSAQTLVFEPVADARVNYASPDTNYVTDDLRVEWDRHTVHHNVERSFLRFDLSGISGQSFDCITLVLTATDGGDSHFEVRAVTAPWMEDQLDWNTQPSTGGVLGSYTKPVAVGETVYVTLDPNGIRSDGLLNLALIAVDNGATDDGRDQIAFESREDPSPPQLVFGCDTVPLRAGFATKTREGAVPLTVRFTNQSSMEATSFVWDFGDGGTATTRTSMHTFTTPGRYTITLTVTGPGGSDTHVRTGYVFAYPEEEALGSVLAWRRLSETEGGNTPFLDNEDMFGRSVDALGDLDGDGVTDLIVGALGDDDALDENGEDQAGWDDDNRGDNPGAAYVVFMNADGTAKGFQKISNLYGGLQEQLDNVDGFGRYVAGIGDLDGDGVLDACVTACRDDDGGTNFGAVYVLFLNADGTVKAQTKISQTSGGFTGDLDTDDQFGRGVTSMGDMDGDGIQDLATGATGDDDGANRRGAVWILYMNRDGTVKSHAKISDTSGGRSNDWVGAWFGMDVDNLGDVDGDGVNDLAVGTLLDDAIVHAAGGTFVLLMNADGTVKSDAYINAFNGMVTGELEAGDEFGGSVAGIGDVDGDGIPDLAVGSIRDDDNERGELDIGLDTGALFIYFLNSDGTVREYRKISDTRGAFDGRIERYDRFAEALGSLGDWNGDGTPDVLVGTRFDDDGGPNRGSVHILTLSNGILVPVEAEFLAGPTSGDAPLTVAFTDSSIGPVTSWLWDFGDGTTSTDSSPTHVYTVPGTYDVTLMATGSTGMDTHTETSLVTVTVGAPPVADFTADSTSGAPPLAVAFEDRSVGFVTTWAWDFGDGSGSSLASPTHVYDTAGTYDVSLQVGGPGGIDVLTRSSLVFVGEPEPPVALFSLLPASGDAPLQVDFTDQSTGAVSSRLWDFGDGGVSSDAHPTHVYAVPGTYDVTLTATGPFGTDTLVQAGAVVVTAPPAPMASFLASPVVGSAPLMVSFQDASSGVISSYAWTFGDGATSSLSDPTHVYTAEGLYDVSLTVTGPGGLHTSTAEGFVVVSGGVQLGLADGGFEAQLEGDLPRAPWVAGLGGGHRIAPLSLPSDTGFPTEGAQWLEVSASGSFDAQPPSHPGGITQPGTGAGSVSQFFRIPQGTTTLAFEASFLLAGPSASAELNDWMSVDVTDGTRTFNLFYGDSFSDFPLVSTGHGLPQTDVANVRVDLLQVFPGLTEDTVFELRVCVGNGGDDLTSSLGRVDGFRLEPSDPSMLRLGCGTNPVGSLLVLQGSPVLGERMTFGLDNPLGSQNSGASPVLLFSFLPDPAYPCGTPLPGFGMAGGPGELLVSLVPPDPVRTISGPPWESAGTPTPVNFVVPSQASLVGLNVFVQGALIDATPGASPRIGLTDGLHIILQSNVPPPPMELTNLGLGRSATQSSDYLGSNFAGRALDGSTNGDFTGDSLSHTDFDADAFWEVDLEALHPIEWIELWNRADCCPERLDGAWVLVSSDPFVSGVLSDVLDQPGVDAWQIGVAAPTMNRVDVGRSARYVRVQGAGSRYLALAEVEIVGLSTTPTPLAAGLEALYFDELDFTNLAQVRADAVVDFAWGSGAPVTGVGADTFSVRWRGFVEPAFTETYTFTLESDDGVRLWVDGQLVVEDYSDHAPREASGTIDLTAGERVPLVLEYYENGGGATVRMFWEAPSLLREIVPADRLTHWTN